jgi:hypothetical protein
MTAGAVSDLDLSCTPRSAALGSRARAARRTHWPAWASKSRRRPATLFSSGLTGMLDEWREPLTECPCVLRAAPLTARLRLCARGPTSGAVPGAARGAIVARRMRASTSPAPARLTLAAGPASGPAVPGMTSLTRCTAARGTCKWGLRAVPMGATPLTRRLRHRRKSLVLPGQPNLGLYPAQTAAGPGRRLHPHGLQIRTGVRCFSLRLLLYFAAVPGPGTMGSGFRIIVFELVWSYGDSNPGPLACHAVATRPQKCICAGHRLRTSPSVPRNPGRLLYFRAVRIGLSHRAPTFRRSGCDARRPEPAR